MLPAAILDVDGTLVDTNYHHAVAWFRAFRQRGFVLPLWRIHHRMGMGGDKLVADLAGDEAEREHGDAVRAAEGPLYLELMREIEAFPAARSLLEELDRRGHRIVLASSAKPDEVDHYLELIDGGGLARDRVTGADVEETKPAPALIEAALERAEAEPGGAVLVGDSTWDCQAAAAAGIETVGVLTGGFSEPELREAGATCVFTSLEDLIENLDETPLAEA